MKNAMNFQAGTVIVALALSLANPVFAQPVEVASGVLHVGQIQHPEIQESSGIVRARGGKNVYWTHNDSGLDVLYAVTGEGEPLGQLKLKDVDLENIEDVAGRGGRIFVADIGNNDGSRETIAVYAVPNASARRTGEIRPMAVWRLTYPGDAFDAESFFVIRGTGYIISKELSKGEVRAYSFLLNGRRKGTIELKRLCKLDINDEARGADFAPDGRLAIITGSGAYLFLVDKKGLPEDGVLEPALFVPLNHSSLEGCCFTHDGLLATSESRDLFLFTDDQFKYPIKRGNAARRR